MFTSNLVDLKSAQSSWERVFVSRDPFGRPFQKRLARGRLFYPTEFYHLTPRQFDALTSTMNALGEGGFYLSVVESDEAPLFDRRWGHWWFDTELSYDDYAAIPLTLENALYSEQGNWGVLISHEMHALVGGSDPFVSTLDTHYPAWERDLSALREAWAGNPNGAWIESVVAHVTGAR